MLSTIKGKFEEINSEQNMTTRVLYLPCNRSQFEMACIIAKHSKYQSYIFIENPEKYIKFTSILSQENRIKFFNDFKSVASFFKDIDKIVIFIGGVQVFLPLTYNKILSAALELKKQSMKCHTDSFNLDTI